MPFQRKQLPHAETMAGYIELLSHHCFIAAQQCQYIYRAAAAHHAGVWTRANIQCIRTGTWESHVAWENRRSFSLTCMPAYAYNTIVCACSCDVDYAICASLNKEHTENIHPKTVQRTKKKKKSHSSSTPYVIWWPVFGTVLCLMFGKYISFARTINIQHSTSVIIAFVEYCPPPHLRLWREHKKST